MLAFRVMLPLRQRAGTRSGSIANRPHRATAIADRMTRIDRLLAAMTLQEKVGQLTMSGAGFAVTGPVLAGDATEDIVAGRVGSLLNIFGAAEAHRVQRVAVEESRLGIPLFFGFDVLHGHRTIFPIPLAEAATFEPDLWERTARVAAAEAAQDGVHLAFAPMLDVTRDPRWGRIAEGPGEDPLLASVYADAKIRGFQGPDLTAPDCLAATAKHFVAYGAPVAGIDYMSADVSERTLHEVYLPPFEAAIAAGVAAVMPAFHDIAGVPMTANELLLKDWLRKRLGFEGVLISDYNAVSELISHGVAKDAVDAAALALRAGVDIEMIGTAYRRGLPEAFARGLVSAEEIDASVRRVLVLKQSLGLFEDPFRRGSPVDGAGDHAPDRRRLAREVARRSIVLLANDGLLPLAPDGGRIAVVGPLADERVEMRGCWPAAGDPRDPVTMVEGLRAALPQADLLHAPGISIADGDWSRVSGALEICRSADVVILCIGEAALMSGEAASRASLDLPGRQREFAEAVLALGKPVVAILCSGRPLTVSWLAERANATLATWFLGNEAGNAVGDIVTGRASPTGRLPVTWPRALGQVPIYYGQRRSGRPANPADRYTSRYIDLPTTPQFPFGHGLSYGRFAYSDLQVSPLHLGQGDVMEVSVTVTNVGERPAEETAFLFVRDVVASIARPQMELKAFTKIELRPGESGTVVLLVPVQALAFPGRDGRPVLEPGDFECLVGPCADRAQLLSATVTVSDRAVAGERIDETIPIDRRRAIRPEPPGCDPHGRCARSRRGAAGRRGARRKPEPALRPGAPAGRSRRIVGRPARRRSRLPGGARQPCRRWTWPAARRLFRVACRPCGSARPLPRRRRAGCSCGRVALSRPLARRGAGRSGGRGAGARRDRLAQPRGGGGRAGRRARRRPARARRLDAARAARRGAGPRLPAGGRPVRRGRRGCAPREPSMPAGRCRRALPLRPRAAGRVQATSNRRPPRRQRACLQRRTARPWPSCLSTASILMPDRRARAAALPAACRGSTRSSRRLPMASPRSGTRPSSWS